MKRLCPNLSFFLLMVIGMFLLFNQISSSSQINLFRVNPHKNITLYKYVKSSELKKIQYEKDRKPLIKKAKRWLKEMAY
nr:hypothetical protein [uncultured Moellerella sp.]